MKLIAGLGNPGSRYAETRHNAGFLVVEELARRKGLTFKKQKQGLVARFGDVRLLKPTTMMNLSGRAVQAEATKGGIRPEEIVVVHDDLHLYLGRLRFKSGGGGHGGQNGVRDIISRLGPDFVRLKVGIGQPERGDVEWVLGKFRTEERGVVDRVVAAAADALEVLLAEGLEAATNRVNGVDYGEEGEEGEGELGALESQRVGGQE
jgi:PTH1 family peptidyl-tRNA hydrolase